MSTPRTYHRTLLLVEVLGDRPYTGGIEDLHRSTFDGDFSGTVLMEQTDTVSREQVEQLLTMQGSSPEFLVPEDDAPCTACAGTGQTERNVTEAGDYDPEKCPRCHGTGVEPGAATKARLKHMLESYDGGAYRDSEAAENLAEIMALLRSTT